MYQHILLATDDSPAAHCAERAGIEMAARLTTRLYVLRVLAPEPAVSMVADVILGEAPGLRTLLHADEHMAKVRAAAKAAGVSCQTEHVFDNRPATVIAGVAREHHCDLIMIGAHGGNGLIRLLEHDTTRKVIMDCDVSVLVCR